MEIILSSLISQKGYQKDNDLEGVLVSTPAVPEPL